MDDKLTTKQAITVLRNLQDWLYYSSMNGGTSIQREAIDIAIKALEAEPHWIPVTEDTPTENDDYWCTFDAETGRFVDWCSWYQGRWVVWTDDTVSEVSNVIAWCKPIEPYKGVTE